MDFLRRNGFWVAVGAVLVVALVLWLAGVQVTAAQNRGLRRELGDTVEEVRGLAGTQPLRNQLWVEKAEQYEAELRTQYEQALDLVQGRSVDAHKLLPRINAEDCETVRISDDETALVPKGALFKSRYPEVVAELRERLESANISVGVGAIGMPLLTGAIPDPPTVLLLQRRYWLLRDVVDALVEHEVKVNRLVFLTEEAAEDRPDMFGGGPEGGALAPMAVPEELRAMGGGGRSESEALRQYRQLAAGDVGTTTAMNLLFAPGPHGPGQRRVRLVVMMDERQLPVLIQALLSMSRLTLVRTVEMERVLQPGEQVRSPEVRVDIRALCFDRYRKFVPTEVER
jgi:hypothetical protein